MPWTRSEPAWDRNCERPDNHQNDGARFARQVQKDMFESHAHTRQGKQNNNNNNNNSQQDNWDGDEWS